MMWENNSVNLDKKHQQLAYLCRRLLGYPCNARFNYKNLAPFFDYPLNNVGDPFSECNYQVNTHEFEREVIAYVAKLYGQLSDYWGYVSLGGTEGNILGVHLGRLHYPNGYVYYSQHSHYSITKAINLTRSHAIEIAVQDNGEINYSTLTAALVKNKEAPAIIVANIGTTMTGAIDDLAAIKSCLKEANIQEYHIHCDAALHGMILPFRNSPKMFTLSDIDSLTISGHKLIGSPLPCGIFLCKASTIKSFSEHIDYIHTADLTLSGSRSGLTPLILWQKFFKNNDLNILAQAVIEKADYAVHALQKLNIDAWRNEDSPIVVFPKPSKKIIKKWQLAQQNNIAHIVTLSHVSERLIDTFVKDLHLDSLECGADVAATVSNL